MVFYELLLTTRGLNPIQPFGAMYMMVGIDLDCFPDFSSDVEFTERLLTEESVFCLPASVSRFPTRSAVVKPSFNHYYVKSLSTVHTAPRSLALNLLFVFQLGHLQTL